MATATQDPPITDPTTIQLVQAPEAETPEQVRRRRPHQAEPIKPKIVDDDTDFEAEDQPMEALPPSAPAEEPEPDSKPAPVSKHSPRLLRVAKALGLSEEEANGMESAQLEQEIRYARMEAEHNEAVDRRREEQRRNQPAPEPEPEEQIDWGQAADGTPWTEKDYPAPIRNAIKAAHENKKEVKALKAALAQERSSRRAETFAEGLERRFAEDTKRFGQGKLADLKPNSPEYRKRLAIANLVQQLDGEQGSFDSKYNHIYESVYGEQATAPAPKPSLDTPENRAFKEQERRNAQKVPEPYEFDDVPEPEVEKTGVLNEVKPRGTNGRFTEKDYAGAALAKPTERRAAALPPGVKRAKETFKQIMRERGQSVDEMDEDFEP